MVAITKSPAATNSFFGIIMFCGRWRTRAPGRQARKTARLWKVLIFCLVGEFLHCGETDFSRMSSGFYRGRAWPRPRSFERAPGGKVVGRAVDPPNPFMRNRETEVPERQPTRPREPVPYGRGTVMTSIGIRSILRSRGPRASGRLISVHGPCFVLTESRTVPRFFICCPGAGSG